MKTKHSTDDASASPEHRIGRSLVREPSDHEFGDREERRLISVKDFFRECIHNVLFLLSPPHFLFS
jgi:hypothetical protein